MRITAIKSQRNRQGKYSIFIDGRYEFSLTDTALLESKLTTGQAITAQQLKEFKELAAENSLYDQASHYALRRLRTTWEMRVYLEKLNASPALIEYILNKLSNIGLIDDAKYVAAYVHDRQSFHPTSRRTILMELRNKHIANEAIDQAFDDGQTDESTALLALITRKRKQSRYQNDVKLTQYLVRQGFNYYDIKALLEENQA